MDISTIIFFVIGLILLVIGANVLVRGASDLARGWGISPLVVGLTVVAYGTSAPEMAVSVAGAVGGKPDVAMGNVLGSAIANVLLILGLSALFGRLVVAHRLVRGEVPFMVALSVIVLLMSLNGVLGRLEAGFLLVAALAYTVITVRSTKKEEKAAEGAETEQEPKPWYVNVALVVVGIAGLVGGSQLLVNSAVEIAGALGLSELIIGLTVVAIGTSLPEIATSIAAALKGDRDIAVGNVIGSNIFNFTAVLGLAGLASPGGLPVAQSLLSFDLPIVIAACFACLPVFFTGGSVRRWEGAVFLAFYAAYLSFLVLNSTEHARADDLANAMLFFVAPITVITTVILVGMEVSHRRSAAAVG